MSSPPTVTQMGSTGSSLISIQLVNTHSVPRVVLDIGISNQQNGDLSSHCYGMTETQERKYSASSMLSTGIHGFFDSTHETVSLLS